LLKSTNIVVELNLKKTGLGEKQIKELAEIIDSE